MIVILASRWVSRFSHRRRRATIREGLLCCGKRIIRDMRWSWQELLRRTSSHSNSVLATRILLYGVIHPPTDTMGVEDLWAAAVNSFTPFWVWAGTKNSRPVGFLQYEYYGSSVDHRHNPLTNIITMVVPFAPSTTAWYLWIFPI